MSEYIESHSEKQILEGCISVIQEMVDGWWELPRKEIDQ